MRVTRKCPLDPDRGDVYERATPSTRVNNTGTNTRGKEVWTERRDAAPLCWAWAQYRADLQCSTGSVFSNKYNIPLSQVGTHSNHPSRASRRSRRRRPHSHAVRA